MTGYTNINPAFDVEIAELKDGQYRVKLIGFVVNTGENYISINDGTDQIQIFINLDRFEMESFSIGKAGRFIVDINKNSDDMYGRLIAWHPIEGDEKELIKKYRRLVEIERRIPK